MNKKPLQTLEEVVGENQPFYTVFQQSPAIIVLLKGKDHVFEFANPLAIQYIGKGENIIGKKVKDVLPEVVDQGYIQLLDNVYTTGETFFSKGMRAIINNHGIFKEHFFDFVYQPFKNRQGEIIGLFIHAIDVTEQVLSQKKIQEDNAFLTTLTENIIDAVISTDSNYTITSWNKGAEKMYGWKEKEVMGLNALSFIDTKFPNNPDGRKEWQMSLKQKGQWLGEVQQKRKDGKIITVFSSIAAIKDTKGNITGAVAVNRDITDKKQDEETLRQSELYSRALINASSDVIYRMSPDWKEMRQLQGKNFLEDTGKPDKNWLKKYIHPLDQKRVLEAIQKAINTKSIFQLEHQVKMADGTLGWTFSRAVPIFDNDHNIIEWFGTATDITERKNAEERFRILADNIPTLCWMANPDGQIFWFNKRWYEYTGLTQKQSLGWGWQSVHDPKILPEVIKQWKISLKTGELFEMIFPLLGKDGNFRHFLTRVVPIKNEKNDITYWFGVNTDITEQIIQEQRKDTFIDMASHELKTPLTSMKLYTQILLEEFKDNPKSLLMLQKMNAQVDNLTVLVSEMLDTTRLQHGKLELKNEKIIIKDTVVEILDELQPITRNKIIIDWQTHEYVYADKERLRQVLSNFITNAIKYSPETKDIVVKSRKRDSIVVVSVQDFGIGIPKADQARIFDRFYQVSQHATYPGVGLGLYICKEIIKRMHGKIWVKSEEGKGSTFSFSLPIYKGK